MPYRAELLGIGRPLFGKKIGGLSLEALRLRVKQSRLSVTPHGREVLRTSSPGLFGSSVPRMTLRERVARIKQKIPARRR